MKCCVPACTNASNNAIVSEEITFHSFPHELHLCAAWLRVLGVEDCLLPDPAFVCSLHFLNDDFYETTNGLKKLQSDAVPSIVHVCIACLDTESRLYSLRRYNMEEAYENLTGILLRDIESLPHTLCLECTQRLSTCSKFRDKSLRANSLLINLVEKHKLVTIENVKTINRVEHKLTSNIVQTVFDPDYCDMYILECSEEDAQVELNRIVDEIALNTQKDTDRDFMDTNHFVDTQTILSNIEDDPITIKNDNLKHVMMNDSVDSQAELEDSVNKVIANIHKFTATKETNRNTFYCSLADAQTQLDHFVDKVTASLQDTTNIYGASDNVKEYNVRCNTCPLGGSKLGFDHLVEPTSDCNKSIPCKELDTKFKLSAFTDTQLQDIENRSTDRTNISATPKYVYKIKENGAKMNNYIFNYTQMKSNKMVDKKITSNKIIVNAPKKVIKKSSDNFHINSQVEAIGMTIKSHDIIANTKGKVLKTRYLLSTELKKNLYKMKEKRTGKIIANTYKLNKVNRKAIESPWAEYQDNNYSSSVDQVPFLNIVKNMEKDDIDIIKKKRNVNDYPLPKIQRRVHKIVGKVITKDSEDTTSHCSITSTDRGLVYCEESVNNHMDTSKWEMKKAKNTHCLVPDEQKKLNSYEDEIVNNVNKVSSNIRKTTALIGVKKKPSSSILGKQTKSVHFSDKVTINIYESASSNACHLQSENLLHGATKSHEKTVDRISNSFSENETNIQDVPFTKQLHTIKSDCLLSDPKIKLHGILNKRSTVDEITKDDVEKVINRPQSSNLVNIQEDNYWNKKNENANNHALSDIQTEINLGKLTKKYKLYSTKDINKESSECTLIGTKRQLDYINEVSSNNDNRTNFNIKIAETNNHHILDKQKKLKKTVGNVTDTLKNVNKNCMIVAENTNNIISIEQATFNFKNNYSKPNNCSSPGVKLNKTVDKIITHVDEVTTDIQEENTVKGFNKKDYSQVNLHPQSAQLVNADSSTNGRDNAYNNNVVTKTLPLLELGNKASIAEIGYEQKNIVNTKEENIKRNNCSADAQIQTDKIVDNCTEIILDASSNNEHRCVGIFTETSEETKEEINVDHKDNNAISDKKIPSDISSLEVILDDYNMENNSIIEKKPHLDCIRNLGRTGFGITNHMVWFPVKSTMPIAHRKIKRNKSIKQKLQSNKNMKNVPLEIHTKRRLKRLIESKLADEIAPLAKKQKVTSSSVINDQITEIDIDHRFDNSSCGSEIVQPEIKGDKLNKTRPQEDTSFSQDKREDLLDVSKSATGKDKVDSGISEVKNHITDSVIKVLNYAKKRPDINKNNSQDTIPFENRSNLTTSLENRSNRNTLSKDKATKSFELKHRHIYADNSLKTLNLNNIINKNREYLNQNLEKNSTCDLMIKADKGSGSNITEDKKDKTHAVMNMINSDNANKLCKVTLQLPSSIASEGNNSCIDPSKAEKNKIADPKMNIETNDSNSECSVGLLNHISNITKENKFDVFQYSVNNRSNIESKNDLDNDITSNILRLKDKSFNLTTFNSKTAPTIDTKEAINNADYSVELTNHISSVNKSIKISRNTTDAHNINIRILRNQTHCDTKTFKSKYLNTPVVKKNMISSTKLNTDRNKKNVDNRDMIRNILSCDVCDYKTDRKKYMESHVLLHNGKKDVKKIYSCTYCKYKTKNRHHLEYHLRTHTGEKPFNCNFCEHRFARKTNLVNHMRTHTGEKPFSCKFCSYRCTDSSNLKTHMRTHTKEKPFSCKFCNYTSIQSSTLVSHMRKHTGEKPFACDVCHKKFSGKGNLIKHQRTHLDIRPFVCKICQNKFSQKSNLLRHLKIHTS